MKEVLVTGHNQSQSSVEMGYEDFQGRSSIYYAGIHGQNGNNGKVIICKSVIRDNFSGPGVYDVVKDGASRGFKFIRSEVSALVRSSLEDQEPYDVTTFGYGVVSVSLGIGSKKVGRVYKSSALDFLCNFGEVPSPTEENPDATRRTRNIGFSGEVFGGAETTFTVEKSLISRINVKNLCRGFGVYGFGLGGSELSINKLNFNVICSVISSDEIGTAPEDDSNGITTLLENTDIISLYKDNTIFGVRNSILEADTGPGNNKTLAVIDGNNTQSSVQHVITYIKDSNRSLEYTIKNNNMTSESFRTSVWEFNIRSPFENYRVTMENNCFKNFSINRWDAIFINNSGSPNVLFEIHQNNILSNTGEAIILDGSETGLVNAQQNFFDGAFNGNFSNMVLDVSNQLLTPIVCPKKKYCLPEVTLEPMATLSVKSLTEEEKLEARRNRKRDFI